MDSTDQPERQRELFESFKAAETSTEILADQEEPRLKSIGKSKRVPANQILSYLHRPVATSRRIANETPGPSVGQNIQIGQSETIIRPSTCEPSRRRRRKPITLHDQIAQAIDESDQTVRGKYPAKLTLRRNMNKRKPSKYDHFHEKTYISTFVPTLGADYFVWWERSGIPYKVPEPVAPPGPRTASLSLRTSYSPRDTKDKWAHVKSVINSTTGSSKQLETRPSTRQSTTKSPGRKQSMAEWPVICVPNGTDIAKMDYVTINLSKFWAPKGSQAMKDKLLQDMLMYVSKLMQSRKTFNYAYSVDGDVITEIDEIPKTTKAIVVSFVKQFKHLKESITQEQVIQTHAGRWMDQNCDTRNTKPPRQSVRRPKSHMRSLSDGFNIPDTYAPKIRRKKVNNLLKNKQHYQWFD